MKKTILFIAAGLIATGANAQSKQAFKNLPWAKTDAKAEGTEAVYMPGVQTMHYGKATIAQIGSTETWGGSLAGWIPAASSGTVSPKWVNAGTNPNYFPDLASASAGDGWVIFDFNDNTGTAPVDATLTSPSSFSFTGHAHVGVTISEWHNRFQDSVYIDVATGPSGPWTSYAIYQNNTLRPNDETDNPFNTLVNISATAGNQGTVYIRFHLKGDYQGYGWAFDDLKFFDLDPVDVRLQRSAHTYKTGNYEEYPLGVIPMQFMTEVHPFTFVDNYGYNAQTNLSVNSSITTTPAGGPTYNQNKTLANLAVSGFDSAINYTSNPFSPDLNTPYRYTNVFTQGSATDTAEFSVTDTTWLQARPSFTAHGYYLNKSAAPAFSYEYCTIFNVPYGKSDTLTSMNLSLYNGSGQTVAIQIYTYDDAGGIFQPVASATKTLIGSDVSNTSITWSSNFFPADASNNSPILTGGTNDSFGQNYYVVVKTINATQDVVLWTADAPAFPATEYFGGQALQDTSDNSDTYTFGNGTIFGFTTVPCVKLNFGVPQTNLAIQNVANKVKVFEAYPNPANNNINIPFMANAKGNVTVSITNSLGQVIKSQTLNGVQAGVQTTATLPTSDLASGTYFFTVESNGNRSSGRFTIKH